MLFTTYLWALGFAVVAAPWRSYEVYQPAVERSFVNDTQAQALKYNHDSSVAWFGDRWHCLWNANEPPAEGRPGQLNYQSTSPDGRAWSPPVACFSTAELAENPVPCPDGTQWQPNLLVVGEELWAVWSQSSRDDHHGTYLSRLRRPGGKWLNQRMLFDGDPNPLLEGRRWRIFATQNPYRLRSGRVLAPVVISDESRPAADAPPGVESWWAREKRDTVLWTDDLGQTWHCSPGTIQAGRSWAQWEPTVWELPDGTVLMVARNNDFRGRQEDGPRPAQMLLSSVSTDQGETWSPHRYVPLETVASRMHVLPFGGDRYVMVHNDWPAGRFVQDRQNLALFFTRGAGFDFVAGPGLTDDEPVVCYPQMGVHGDELLVSYSQGMQYRSIKVARVSPLPQPDVHYLFPRSNLPAPPRPRREGDVLVFRGGQRVETRAAVDPGPTAFSLAAVLRPGGGGGVLLDTRTTTPPGGFLWGLSGDRPFVYLGTPERNLTSTLRLPGGRWSYVGATVDHQAGMVTFFVNGRSDEVKFTAPAPQPLRGTTGYVGWKRFEGSQVAGLDGEVRLLAVYPEARLGQAEHNWVLDRVAASVGLAAAEPATAPSTQPAVWLDPVDETAFARDFALPEGGAEGVEVATVDGTQVLRFRGEASAGVDLDDNERSRGDTVRLRLRFKLAAGDGQVVCTVGDANQPARVVVRGGEVHLIAGEHDVAAGPVAGGWTSLELTSGGDQTSVAVNGGPPATVHHQPEGTWLYLGQGYRTGEVTAEDVLLIDVGSVASAVN